MEQGQLASPSKANALYLSENNLDAATLLPWLAPELDAFAADATRTTHTISRTLQNFNQALAFRQACFDRNLHCQETNVNLTQLIKDEESASYKLVLLANARAANEKSFCVGKSKLRCAQPIIAPYVPTKTERRNFPASEPVVSFAREFGPTQLAEKPALVERAMEVINMQVKAWIGKRRGDGGGDGERKKHVFLSGSASMGIFEAQSDVDLVCLVDKTYEHCTREGFFTDFVRQLESFPLDFTQLTTVEYSKVPLIKLKFRNVLDVDLLLALSANVNAAQHDVLGDKVLDGMDASSSLSWSGPRNAELIKSLVGDRYRRSGLFHSTLLIIRAWAKTRHIYSSKLGYLGGLTWAILLGLICQLFPNAQNETELLYWFFKIYSRWDWDANLVKLCDGAMDNAIYAAGNYMPVMTPATPSTNSAYTVTSSTRQAIVREFNRADKIFKSWLAAEEEGEGDTRLSLLGKLFDEYGWEKEATLENKHRVLWIMLQAKTRTGFCKLLARVEARILHLVRALEKVSNVTQVRLDPIARMVGDEENATSCHLYIELGESPLLTFDELRACFYRFCTDFRIGYEATTLVGMGQMGGGSSLHQPNALPTLPPPPPPEAPRLAMQSKFGRPRSASSV